MGIRQAARWAASLAGNEPRPIREINPEIPTWLCRVIQRLLSKSPDDRYTTAEDVSVLLQRCLVHKQSPNIPLPVELQTKSTWSRLPRKTRTTLSIFAAIIVGASLLYSTAPETKRSPFGHSTGEFSQPSADNAHPQTHPSEDDGDSLATDIQKPPVIAKPDDKETLPLLDNDLRNDTAWNDNVEVSPSVIRLNAQRLAEETQSNFAYAPAATTPRQEGIDE